MLVFTPIAHGKTKAAATVCAQIHQHTTTLPTSSYSLNWPSLAQPWRGGVGSREEGEKRANKQCKQNIISIKINLILFVYSHLIPILFSSFLLLSLSVFIVP